MFTAKSVFGSDVRRFAVSTQTSLAELTAVFSDAYQLEEPFQVLYLDDENELITIQSDEDLRGAYELYTDGAVKMLRFHVQIKNQATRETPAPEATPINVPASSVPGVHGDQVPPIEDDHQQTPSDEEAARLLRDLLRDPAVVSVLPQVAETLLISTMEGHSAQSALEGLFMNFPQLGAHPSVVALMPLVPRLEVLRDHLVSNPQLLGMASMMIPQLAQVIPVWLAVLEASVARGDDASHDFVPPPMPFPVPPMSGCGFFGNMGGEYGEKNPNLNPFEPANANLNPNVNPSDQTPRPCQGNQASEPEEVHVGVMCDGCNVMNIRGIRFKCATCPDYDLCAACEAADAHGVEHPLIKIKVPIIRNAPPPPPLNFPSSPTSALPPFMGNNPHNPNNPSNPFFMGGMRGLGCGFRDFGRFFRGGRGGGHLGRGGCRGYQRGKGKSALKADFVKDVNLLDRTEVETSQTLVKTWIVSKGDTASWPKGVKLVYMRGDLPSVENDYDVDGSAEVGQMVEVSAVVRTPATPGRYRAYFRLQDDQGNRFGPRLWCDLTVTNDLQSPVLAEASSPAAALSTASTLPSAASDAPPTVAPPELEEKKEKAEAEVNPNNPATPAVGSNAHVSVPVDSVESEFQQQLQQLRDMGWGNVLDSEEFLTIVQLLRAHQGDVQRVCNALLERGQQN